MPIDRPTLEQAICASGGKQPDEQIEGLLAKLQELEAAGRYGGLLKHLIQANDRSNFLSCVLEATFAHQFERAGLSLEHEVTQAQDSAQGSTVDFALKLPENRTAYFELHLIQQDKATAESIAKQLSMNGAYAIWKDEDNERKEVLRVQGTILGKVQDSDGNPVKFFQVDEKTFNIVVVCISDILLGTADHYDCLLATYGDPEVPEACRLGMLGMFQSLTPEDPDQLHAIAARFNHFRATIHAVLFLFRPPGSGVLDYALQQMIVWNRALVTQADAALVTGHVNSAAEPLQ